MFQKKFLWLNSCFLATLKNFVCGEKMISQESVCFFLFFFFLIYTHTILGVLKSILQARFLKIQLKK